MVCLTRVALPCSLPQVVDLVPKMQQSLETQLRAVVQAGAYVQREAGEALYTEGEAADSIMLLVQGQVRGLPQWLL